MQTWLDSISLVRWLADCRAEWAWRRSDRLGPLPARAKRRLLREYAREFRLRTLVETGTYLGDTVAALRGCFDRLYSIELSPRLARKAQRRFRSARKITVIEGDSATGLREIIRDEHSPMLFWLDAHYSAGVTARGPLDTPVMAEVEAIVTHPVPGNVVLIDDAAWLDEELGGNGLEQIRARVRAAHPQWTLELRNDVLRTHAPAATRDRSTFGQG